MSIEELYKIFDQSQVSQDPSDLETYGRDWVKHYKPDALAVVFPNSAEQVQKLVLWARKNKQALVPSGGRTGLSAGALAAKKEIVVSFDKMNRILEFDPIDQTITCEAGVVTEAAQDAAKEHGLFFPVDFAARGSSHIGGNVATNAGGIKVVRYGLMRRWVAGLQVVTGTGEILNLNRSLIKNAVGYDLRQLFIGSEGTLGFITQVTMQLHRQPVEPQVLVCALNSLDSVMKVFQDFRIQFDLSAYEFWTDLALKKVLHYKGISNPFQTTAPFYVLLEIESESLEIQERMMAVLEPLMGDGTIADAVLAQTPAKAKELWSLRENISECLAPDTPYKNDISVRIARVTEFLNAVDRIIKSEYPNFEVVWFGHIGDGNLHVNVLKPKTIENSDFLKACEKVNQLLFTEIKRFGGSISAEHGVGIVKKPFLSFSLAPAEIEFMKKIKATFDPDNIINPGKVL